MDLILSEEPSTDAHVMQLEPAEVEVDPLVKVQRGKVLSMSTLPFVSKHFRFIAFQYILGLISYLLFALRAHKHVFILVILPSRQ